MPRRTDVIYGTPCWMDLSTSDPERAKTFYGELFGWTSQDTGEEYGHYVIFSKDGAGIAGMVKKTDDLAGMPDVWTVYLGVEDADATMHAAADAGGQRAFDPIQVGELGTMGVLTDPSSAFVGIWQPGTHRGFERFGEPGAPAWHELLSLDFDAAADFYAKVFGVTLADENTGEGGPRYKTFTVDGESYAGLMDATGFMPEGVPSNWQVYYGVADTDAAVQTATGLGGAVRAPATDSPYGRFALLADPMGAVFAVLSMPTS